MLFLMKFEKWIYFIRETNNDLSCSILVKREYCCHAIHSFKIILSSRVKRFWVIGMGSSIKYVRKIFRKTRVRIRGLEMLVFSEHFAYVLNGWLLFLLKRAVGVMLVFSKFLWRSSLQIRIYYLEGICKNLSNIVVKCYFPEWLWVDTS